MHKNSLISVIIPVYNGSKYIQKCIDSLKDSIYKNFEIIVVDDNSQDNSCDIARKYNVTLYEMKQQSGPAAARNVGAKNANGNILFFLDSDITARPDTLRKIVDIFEAKPDIAAVFGSYDTAPFEKGFLSQYKNLVHHYVHQHSSSDAKTFWAGCGAIKKEIYMDVGGFDEMEFKTSCIEDIELGYRLRSKGYKIFLDKTLQVKHLKKWSVKNYFNAEIFHRAVPWSRLIVDSGNYHNDLNLKISDRISAFLVWLIIFVTGLFIVDVVADDINLIVIEIFFLFFLFILFLILNYNFYQFLLVNRGLLFLIKSIPLHILYYLYSSTVFTSVWLKSRINSEN